MGEQVSRILVVDDDPHVGKVLFSVLRQAGHEPRHETSAAAALKAVEDGSFDLVISDIRMPGMDGIELLGELKKRDPAMPVVMITAHGSVKTAVEAMKLGAAEFVEKPFDNAELVGVVARELEKSEVVRDAPPLQPTADPSGILGSSPRMAECLATVRKVAPMDTMVRISGESGTGKELVARALHKQSKRAGGPFIAVNCGAIPASLIEAELFGRVDGAWTDGVGDRPGKVGLSAGGTLFLDEVGELPMAVQPKLLRFLQEKEYAPVGGGPEKPIDVRFVAATNRDLEAMVAEGTFREDLYYRLNVVSVELPPLRERGNDVELLAKHFLGKMSTDIGRPGIRLDDEGLALLRGHDFPGNVRELENVIERLVVFADGDVLGAAHVDRALGRRPSSPSLPSGDGESLKDARAAAEKEKILAALRACRGNKTKTARVIKVARRTLYNRMEELGIPLDFS